MESQNILLDCGPNDAMALERLKRVREIIGKGLTVRETATRLKVGKTVLYEALRA